VSGTVTAVIPTTGTRQDQLLRALESVRLQSYPVIETVIVVDADESATSGVRALVANLDFPCPVIIDRLVGSTGPAAARNRAVELSNGEWVALLDDDDVWESNKLAKQLPWATARDLDACGTRSTLMTSTGTLIYPRKLLHVGDNVARLLLWVSVGIAASGLHRYAKFLGATKSVDRTSLPGAIPDP